MADGDPPRFGGARAGALALLLLLAAATALGLHDVRRFEATDPLARVPYGDSLVYLEEARRHFGTSTEGPETRPGAFYKPPLTTWILARLDADTEAGAARFRRLQLVLGLVTLASVFLLAHARAGAAAGFAAGLLLLGYAPFAFHQTKLLDTLPSLALTAASFVLLDRMARRGGGVGLGLAAGLLLGVSALARAANLVFLVLVAFLPRGRATWPGRAAILVGAIVPVAATAVRNHEASGDWIPVNYSEGHTFLVGNHPGARGIYDLPPGYPDGVGNEREVERALARAHLGRDPSPAEQRDHSYRTALGFLKADPGAAVRREIDKLRFAVDAYPVNDNHSLHRERERFGLLPGRFVPFPLLLVLGLAGLFARSSRPRGPLALPIVVTSVLLLAFYVTERYRLPAAPFLAAAGGVGLARLFDPGEGRRVLTGVALVGGAWLLFTGLRPLPYPPAILRQNEQLFDLSLDLYAARALARDGDVAAAGRTLARSVVDHPRDPRQAELEAALLDLLHGRSDDEVAEIAAAVRSAAPGAARLEALLRLAGAPPLSGGAGG
ncbi:MAG: hypothetical protein ACF8XB_06260 [Planctomycetota bacterium JB042]